MTQFGFFGCFLGLLLGISAYDHFTWGKAATALLLFYLGIWLIRVGMQRDNNNSWDDGPDVFDLIDAAGDFGDMFDD